MRVGVVALADQAQGIVEVWLNTQAITVRFAGRILAIAIYTRAGITTRICYCMRATHPLILQQ